MIEATLSEPAYDLWIRGGLHRELGIADDGRTRVEVVGGEIVTAPLASMGHVGIVADVQEAFIIAGFVRPAFPWQALQSLACNLDKIRDGLQIQPGMALRRDDRAPGTLRRRDPHRSLAALVRLTGAIGNTPQPLLDRTGDGARGCWND